jgi:E3 ubiquitin-protein ligase UBR4
MIKVLNVGFVTTLIENQVACHMVDSFCNVHHRKKDIIDLLTSYLDNLGEAGEAAADFCALYQRLVSFESIKSGFSIHDIFKRSPPIIGNTIWRSEEPLDTLLS